MARFIYLDVEALAPSGSRPFICVVVVLTIPSLRGRVYICAGMCVRLRVNALEMMDILCCRLVAVEEIVLAPHAFRVL